jgi:16S rRNA (guanine966-N2)-methyltransferase
MIRVAGGTCKGRRLRFIKTPAVRPMQDKLKGTLFNIIRDKVEGSWFLDGFAGTGSVGVEALSRGAARAVFVDEYYPAVKVVKANVELCGFEDAALVLHKEFNRAIIDLAKQGVAFDIVFLDPPYKLLETRNPLKVVRKRAILKENGLLVIRHYFKIRPDDEGFVLQRSIKISDDIISFYVLPPPAKSPGRGEEGALRGAGRSRRMGAGNSGDESHG